MGRIETALSVVGAAVIVVLFVFILTHVSLTMHHTAVQAARNDRAINGIIDELGGRRAWTDGSYWDSLWVSEAFTVGKVTILTSGEVDYPGDVSKAAREFWEAVIKAFPEMDWGPPETVGVEK